MRNCTFRSVGKTTNCNRNCRGEYCFLHNALIKKKGRASSPCLICDKGCYTELQICGYCCKTYSTSRLKEKINKIMDEKKISYDEAKTELIDTLKT